MENLTTSPKHLKPEHYNLILGIELNSESLFCRDLRARWADLDLLDNLENLQVSHLINFLNEWRCILAGSAKVKTVWFLFHDLQFRA